MGLSKRLIAAWTAFKSGVQDGPQTTIDHNDVLFNSPDIVTARVFGKLRRVQLTGIAGPFHMRAQAVDGVSGSYLIQRFDVVESDRLKYAKFAESQYERIADRNR